MTYWLELLVDEELRDLVADELSSEIEETLRNPFMTFPEIEWTDALHSNPHGAVFRTKDRKIVKVRFWVKLNPSIGEPYQNPLMIDEERLVITVTPEK